MNLKFRVVASILFFFACSSFVSGDYAGENLLLTLGADVNVDDFNTVREFWLLDQNLTNSHRGLMFLVNDSGKVQSVLIAGEGFQLNETKFSKYTLRLPYGILLDDDTLALRTKLGKGQKLAGQNTWKFHALTVAIEVDYGDMQTGKISFIRFYRETKPEPHPAKTAAELKKAPAVKKEPEAKPKQPEQNTHPVTSTTQVPTVTPLSRGETLIATGEAKPTAQPAKISADVKTEPAAKDVLAIKEHLPEQKANPAPGETKPVAPPVKTSPDLKNEPAAKEELEAKPAPTEQKTNLVPDTRKPATEPAATAIEIKTDATAKDKLEARRRQLEQKTFLEPGVTSPVVPPVKISEEIKNSIPPKEKLEITWKQPEQKTYLAPAGASTAAKPKDESSAKEKLDLKRKKLEEKTFTAPVETAPVGQPIKISIPVKNETMAKAGPADAVKSPEQKTIAAPAVKTVDAAEANASPFKKALLEVFKAYKESYFFSIKTNQRSSGNFWNYQFTYGTKLKIPGEKFNMLYSFPFPTSQLDFVSVIKEADAFDNSFVTTYKEFESRLMKEFPASDGWKASCIVNKESKTLSDLEFSNDKYGSIVLDYSKSPRGRHILYLRFLLYGG